MFTVAIDGPAAAGKGTISRAIASHFGFACLDTGLLYRAVTRKYLDRKKCGEEVDPAQIAADLSEEDLERGDLREPEVSNMSSVIAAIPEVRSAMLDFQRDFSRRPEGAVIDGRDIGTVICPDAEVKIHVTADAKARASRRYLELTGTGINITLGEVTADLRERDMRDRTRGLSALTVCEDAILIDTTEMTICQAIDRAIAAVRSRMESE